MKNLHSLKISFFTIVLNFILFADIGFAQTTPTILINGQSVMASNVSSAPFWLYAGNTLATGTLTKFISVLQYNIAPAVSGGNSLQFESVLLVTTSQTVPTDKAWKIESVALDPSAATFGGDNLGNHVATTTLNMNSNKISNLANPAALNDAVNSSTLQNGNLVYANDIGTASVYAVTLSPAPTSYTTGMFVNFKAANTNTGAATLNVNGLGAKAIKKQGSAADPSYGDIAAGQMVTVVYDGTYFQMIGQLGNVAGGTPHGKQLFTSNGTFTVPAGVTTVWVSMSGGGGGGAYGSSSWGGGGGGGAAAYLASAVTVTPNASISVNIGGGGSGSSSGAGGSGGNTSFGALLTANGGGGGTTSSTGGSAGGAGGSSGGKGINGADWSGGPGGGSLFGCGGPGGYNASGVGGSGYGAGGGGSAQGTGSGGNGSPGFVLVEW